MSRCFTRHVRLVWGAAAAMLLVTACQHPGQIARLSSGTDERFASAERRLAVLDRVTWGVNVSSARQIEESGVEAYLERQLKPGVAVLPSAVQAQIDAMTISQKPLDALLFDVEKRRRAFLALQEPTERRAAQRAYQQELTRLGREAATRSLLRAIYSPNQLEEQMTWFWMNHFNVFQLKGNLRAMIGDYEANAVRPHALGRFRTLLGATARHPAMLRYLDNAQNAAGRINENYARELMELHTLGVDGGYTQEDVQELARILTGVGLALTANVPKVRPDREGDYVRAGAFEFNPNRHDYGDKVFLGQRVKGAGLVELDEVLDRLARHPSTARFISRKLALYFVADDPPAELVERLARTFEATDGDIAATLRALFRSPEFAASLGRKFKDPVHYVVSALRASYDDRPLANAGPALLWLNRMGQGLYGHQTPDGYALTQTTWNGPGQMAVRFEIARAIASGSPPLFAEESAPGDASNSARPTGTPHYAAVRSALSESTLKALEQARSPTEWNVYFLSSPEFMHR
jgi:uncharacterized protein (DUF1800 family)